MKASWDKLARDKWCSFYPCFYLMADIKNPQHSLVTLLLKTYFLSGSFIPTNRAWKSIRADGAVSTQLWEGEELDRGWSPANCAPAWAKLTRHRLHTGNRKTLILKEPKYTEVNRENAKHKGRVWDLTAATQPSAGTYGEDWGTSTCV